MDIANFTESVRSALQSASSMAKDHSHQQIDVEHLFLSLLKQDSSLAVRILEKLNIKSSDAAQHLKSSLSRKPKVQDTSEQYISNRLGHVLSKSQERAKKKKDDYTSVEHVLAAIIEEDKNSDAWRIFNDHGIGIKEFETVVEEIRGGQRVTSANPEATYEALTKYGTDLVQLARDGKMDPVIGRDTEIRSVIRILSRKTKYN